MANIWKSLFQIMAFVSLVGTLILNQQIPAKAEGILADHAIVELFTSQGCSSCPPADAFLGELAKRSGVTALTLPVDYWDYLGWKDTLASRQYSNRQRIYAKIRRDMSVYTPQMVINGVSHAVGSRYNEVNRAIDKARKEFKDYAVPIILNKNGNTIWVKAGNAHQESKIESGTIWIACVKSKIKVSIGRGENTGRAITYYNVVRQLTPVGQWTGQSLNLRLPKQAFSHDNPDFFVALLQANGNGRIIGVARINN